MLSLVQLFTTPWNVAHQPPLSMDYSRPEYWNGLPCPSLGDLPNPGRKPGFPTLSIWESWIQSLGWQDPMEEGMTTHSRILAWRIPIDRGAWWASYSPWDRKESGTTKQLSTAQHKGHVRGNVLSYRVCDLNGHLESSQLQWYPTRPQEPTGIVSKALTLRNANPVALNKACSPLLNCKQKPPNMLCT